MASRLMNYWRSVVSRVGATRSMNAMRVARMKAYAPTAKEFNEEFNESTTTSRIAGEFVAVYVAVGMMVVSVALGAHTAKQQLLYAPNVRVHKKRRESVVEVEEPDRVAAESDRFLTNSVFRKVARVLGVDPFNFPRRVETLSKVGLEPQV